MKTNSFTIKELVSKDYYTKFGDGCWKFLNPLILVVIDVLREKLNEPIIINNWASGGNLSLCGLRPFACSTGAEFSAHKFGAAFDLHFTKSTIPFVFNMIMEDQAFWYSVGLRRMEHFKHTPTWLHLDCLNTQIENKIVIFNI